MVWFQKASGLTYQLHFPICTHWISSQPLIWSKNKRRMIKTFPFGCSYDMQFHETPSCRERRWPLALKQPSGTCSFGDREPRQNRRYAPQRNDAPALTLCRIRQMGIYVSQSSHYRVCRVSCIPAYDYVSCTPSEVGLHIPRGSARHYRFLVFVHI